MNLELGGHYAKRSKSEREKQILYVFTYMWNLMKLNSWKQYRMVAASRGGWKEGGGVGQRALTSSHKMNKFGGYKVWNGDYNKQFYIIYLKVLIRINLICYLKSSSKNKSYMLSPHAQNKIRKLYEGTELLVNLMWQSFDNISNHHILHLKLICVMCQ